MKEDLVKDIVYQAVRATQNENNGLVKDLKTSTAVLETHYLDLKEHIGSLETEVRKKNGYLTFKFFTWFVGIATAVGGSIIGFVYNVRASSVEAQFDSQDQRMGRITETLNTHIKIQNENDLKIAESLGEIKSALGITTKK
jgi:hypothetical protein